MTDLQAAKLRETAQKRREIATSEGIIDLLIEFFEWSNKEYHEGKYQFVGIEWKKWNKKWNVNLIDKFGNKYSGTNGASFPFQEEILMAEFIKRLTQVNQTALIVALGGFSERLAGLYEVKNESDIKGVYMV